jgi:ech hydrogenase subunit A
MLVFIVPLVLYASGKNDHSTEKLAYMGGINTGKNNGFVDFMGEEKTLMMSNYYFDKMLSIEKLMKPAQVVALVALLIIFSMLGGYSIGGMF